LMEISLRIDKTHTQQRNSKIARFLAMIAGQNSKTAGIYRQGSMKTELGRKIPDRFFREIRKFLWKPFVGATRGSIESLHGDFVFAQKIRIAGSRNQTCALDFMKKFDRIMLCVFPKIGIEAFEQEPGAIIPT